MSVGLSGLMLLRPAEPRPILSVTGFDTNSGAGSDVWLRDLDRRLGFRLLASDRLLYTLWLPSGEQLAYFFDDSQGTAVYVYDLTTGRTTVGPVIPRLVPLHWSPDARWLLLYNFSTNEIVAMPRVDGRLGEPVYLAVGSADALWSPDGERLYFRDVTAMLSVIEVACLDGSGLCIPRAVPSERDVDQLAGWMPDGARLMVFAGHRETGQLDLYSLDPTDGDMNRVAEYVLPGTLPAWSPDGQLLALSLALPPNAEPSPGSEPIPGVYVTERGGQARLLWTGVAGQHGWSQDGERLAFELVSRVGNDRSVWVYEPTSGDLRRLTDPGAHEAAPHWLTFRGRSFDALPLLALSALLGLALWWTRPDRR